MRGKVLDFSWPSPQSLTRYGGHETFDAIDLAQFASDASRGDPGNQWPCCIP